MIKRLPFFVRPYQDGITPDSHRKDHIEENSMNMRQILFNDLSSQWDQVKSDVMPKVEKFLSDGMYLGGPEVEKFESDFEIYTGAKHAVGVSNGSDGLRLALEALNISGRVNVIIPANTFVADALAVKYQRGWEYDITYIDPDEYFQMDVDLLAAYLSERVIPYDHTVVIAVHLYGHAMDIGSLRKLKEQHSLFVIEDASQSHGATSNDGAMGSLGEMTVYSLYPGKNLGAVGDAGVITTNSDEYAERLRMLRNYGSRKKYFHEIDGWNNRLDSIQAIVLSGKLPYLDRWNEARRVVAQLYLSSKLSHVEQIKLPRTAPYCTSNSYHVFPLLALEKRDELMEYLAERSIPTIIHYPFPLFDSPVASLYSKQLLSIPIHPFMSEVQVEYIAQNISNFFLGK